MVGSARYTAVLDANVLYPALLRDLLLSLAHADLYSAKWSAHIRDEWMRNLLRDRPTLRVQIAAAAQAMEEAIPDCLVIGYEHLIESLKLPDPDGRHVLAAAIKRMRERWARPQHDPAAFVSLLERRGLPQTAAHLRDVLALI